MKWSKDEKKTKTWTQNYINSCMAFLIRKSIPFGECKSNWETQKERESSSKDGRKQSRRADTISSPLTNFGVSPSFIIGPFWRQYVWPCDDLRCSERIYEYISIAHNRVKYSPSSCRTHAAQWLWLNSSFFLVRRRSCLLFLILSPALYYQKLILLCIWAYVNRLRVGHE